MSLISLIEAVPNWDAKTAQQVFDELSAATVPYVDNELWTWAGIAAIAGDTGASAMCEALIASGRLWAVHQLGGKGLDLSRDDIQGQLMQLHAAGVPGMQSVALAVKRNISKLEQAGITTTVSEVGLLKLKQAKLNAAADRLQAYKEAMASWDGVSTEPVL